MTRRARPAGFGLLEFLVALLVFSGGVLLLLHNQLLGARLAQEGAQRSVATALARDLVTRIQLNPRRAADYHIAAARDIQGDLPAPSQDCTQDFCSAAQLAAFELWQWQRLLHGLVAPAVCVHHAGDVATVAVGWFVREAAGAAAYRCRNGSIAAAQGIGAPEGLYSLKLHAWVGGGG